MYFEGDVVDIRRLDEATQSQLAEALESDFDDIEFYFVEYEGENATISAETDTRFAILKCPRDMIEEDLSMELHAEFLIDDLLRTSMIDHALDTKNHELFSALCEYAKTPALEEVRPSRSAVIEYVDEDDYGKLWES